MGTIKQPGCKDKSYIKLKTMHEECRCCGKGREWVCDSCNALLDRGHAFFIEVKDSSNEQHKKPTGYAIAFIAREAYEHGHPEVTLTPGIYFIRESDLKQFLGDGYNKFNHSARSGAPGRFLHNGAGSRPRVNSGAADSSRSATELAH
jgi:hypothetical protein